MHSKTPVHVQRFYPNGYNFAPLAHQRMSCQRLLLSKIKSKQNTTLYISMALNRSTATCIIQHQTEITTTALILLQMYVLHVKDILCQHFLHSLVNQISPDISFINVKTLNVRNRERLKESWPA